MQDAAGHQAIGFAPLRPAELIAVFDVDLAGANHIEIDAGNAEATLFVGVEGSAGGHDFRVDQHQGRVGSFLWIEVDHQQLLVDSDLRCCQSNAVGCIHAAQHLPRQLPHLFIDFADALGGFAQFVGSQRVDLGAFRLLLSLGDHHRGGLPFGLARHRGKVQGQNRFAREIAS